MDDVRDVLLACYRAIEAAIYHEDGLDGDDGQEVLELVVPHLKPQDQQALADEEQTQEAGSLC